MPISLILTPFDHFHFRPTSGLLSSQDLTYCLNLLPRQFLESPITHFFPGPRVSHYPQFVKEPGNSGVFTVKYNLQSLAMEWGTVCSKYNLVTLSLSGELEYNLQGLGVGWSTVLKSDESGGKVGSSLHCLQIKSLDGLINPQTVRHNVETKLLASFR